MYIRPNLAHLLQRGGGHLRKSSLKGREVAASAGGIGGACARSATIWASGRTRDPYFELLGAPRGIMVTPSGGFARRSTFGSRYGKA